MGAEAAFYVGALFCAIALAALLRQPPREPAKYPRT